MMMNVAQHESPLGVMTVAVSGRGVAALAFDQSFDRLCAEMERWYGAVSVSREPIPRAVSEVLHAYFAGDCDALDALAVDPAGTPFQQKVWSALRKVPAGQTISYQGLAELVGCRGGARAVGGANGSNPICLVIPCHRVIRADGHIGGYGGGLHRKEWLLRHEGCGVRPDGHVTAAAQEGRQMVLASL